MKVYVVFSRYKRSASMRGDVECIFQSEQAAKKHCLDNTCEDVIYTYSAREVIPE